MKRTLKNKLIITTIFTYLSVISVGAEAGPVLDTTKLPPNVKLIIDNSLITKINESNMGNINFRNISAVNGATIVRNDDRSTTIIDQKAAKTHIHWDDFSSNSRDLIKFYQPSANAIAINQVTSGKVSNLRGRLEANGRIVILNDAGVVFAPGSTTNVGALAVATARRINGETFSEISDQGKIEFGGLVNSTEGYVTAVAKQVDVKSTGTINAKKSARLFAGHKSYTVDLDGDGRVTYSASRANLQETSGVSVAGNVNAGRGISILSEANNVASGAINLTGIVDNTTFDAQVADRGNIAINGNNVNLGKTVKSEGNLTITAKNTLATTGSNQLTQANGNLALTGGTGGINLASASNNFSSVDGAVTINSQAATVLKGTMQGKGNLSIASKGNLTTDGGFTSVDGAATINSQAATLLKGNLQGKGDVNVYSKGNLETAGTISGSGVRIASDAEIKSGAEITGTKLRGTTNISNITVSAKGKFTDLAASKYTGANVVLRGKNDSVYGLYDANNGNALIYNKITADKEKVYKGNTLLNGSK